VEKGGIKHLWARTQRNDNNVASLDISSVNDSKDLIKYNITVECLNFGKFLSELNLSDNLIYGDLYLDASLDRNNVLRGDLKLKNGFNYLIEETGDRNTKFLNYVMNNDEVPDSLKKTLKNQNTMGFEKLRASFELADNILRVDDLLLNADDVLGLGISGEGDMNIESGKIKFSGLIVPLEKINTIFGMNKIPILGDMLFGNRGGGLMAIGYEFTKDSFGSSYDFRITPSSIINPFSLKNFLFIFLLL
jgi:hypothetical protein